MHNATFWPPDLDELCGLNGLGPQPSDSESKPTTRSWTAGPWKPISGAIAVAKPVFLATP